MNACLQIAELAGIPAVAGGSNFVFSPLSLVAALSLTASGAKGETLRELLSFLGSPSLNHLHSASVHLAQAVRGSNRELILSFVNGAWVDRSMPVNPSFVAVAASVYGAAIEPADFIRQSTAPHASRGITRPDCGRLHLLPAGGCGPDGAPPDYPRRVFQDPASPPIGFGQVAGGSITGNNPKSWLGACDRDFFRRNREGHRRTTHGGFTVASLEENKINNWIEEKTNGIIKNSIPVGTINDSTRLILTNALYFKGKWQDKFHNFMTRIDKFYLLNGSATQTPFMSSREDQFISSHDGFKVLKLPYKKELGGDLDSRSFSMLLFLPNKRNGLHDLARKVVSAPNFIEEHVPHRRVDVGSFMVPKFKISFSFEASDALKQVGLKSMFSTSSADLGGICLESSRVERLFVSSILHKADVEVDEEGTTASAATVLTVLPTCYTPPVDFVADHPFIFVVREDKTGAILFFGHVVNPSI
ncbi:Serpin-ZX [Platanthera zijinensis]|uniref:Serpin-ZX n=1 Tax=Platanthera zijinensis TaxID=2320716 RepID=A0AAP0AT32_9ASPA